MWIQIRDVSASLMGAARRERRPAAKACTPCCVGRTGRPGARFAFGPLKAGFESSDRLASPIGGSARPCGRRCRLWARDGGLRAHFFAASFGLDTASRGTAPLRFALLGPVLDAGNLQPSASCCTGLRFGEQRQATLLKQSLELRRDLSRDFAWTLPTVPRVLRCLEYVVGFSFGVRPTASLSLQDGWF